MLSRFLVLEQRISEFLQKLYPKLMLCLNGATLIFGLIYIKLGDAKLCWNYFGVLILIVLFGNIALAAMERGQKLLCYLYLVLSSVWMLIVMLINTMVSLNPKNITSQSTVSKVLLISLFFLGALLAFGNSGRIAVKKHSSERKQKEPSNSRIITRIKNAAIILLSGVLYGGLFFSVNLLRVEKNGLLEAFISEYALFLAIIYLSIGALIYKLINRVKYYLYYSISLSVTIFMVVVSMLPIASLPTLEFNAKESFETAFSTEYLHKPEFLKEEFRQIPFSLPEYFFGIPSKDYIIKENILYYEGTEGEDKGLSLYFDAYLPATNRKDLPGEGSVLIRFHGGGWTGGDKGASNFAQMNKYFAAQGYVVFDIQYGLNNVFNWINLTPIPDTVAGNFNINDMVRHIGIFTKYLAEHASEYGANLDSVFLSGGSAGGQLCIASGLAMSDSRYQRLFSPKLKIKGLVPFYPANGLSMEIGISGDDNLMDPSLLINKDSPPCLIYQGSHDGIVSSTIAQHCYDTYKREGNGSCAVIMMPFGGHGSDLYFSGYYNQVFLYYMERFMKLHQ